MVISLTQCTACALSNPASCEVKTCLVPRSCALRHGRRSPSGYFFRPALARPAVSRTPGKTGWADACNHATVEPPVPTEWKLDGTDQAVAG